MGYEDEETTVQERWVQVGDLQHIHYYEAGGGGSPVVLLHGGGVDSAALSWSLLLPVLAQNHRVFAADWPGYGDSDKPQVEYSMEYYLHFLTGLLRAWNLDQVSLVGLSMGGSIALGYTLSAPERVRRLVLVDSYGLQDKAPMQQLSFLLIKMSWLNRWSWDLIRKNRSLARSSLKALLHNPEALTEPLLDQVIAELNRPGAMTAWQKFQESEILWQGTRTCYIDRLPEIAAQTLIVHGREDQAVPLACARLAHERISNSRLEILDGCGHWPQRDRPEEFNRIVAEFLGE